MVRIDKLIGLRQARLKIRTATKEKVGTVVGLQGIYTHCLMFGLLNILYSFCHEEDCIPSSGFLIKLQPGILVVR